MLGPLKVSLIPSLLSTRKFVVGGPQRRLKSLQWNVKGDYVNGFHCGENNKKKQRYVGICTWSSCFGCNAVWMSIWRGKVLVPIAERAPQVGIGAVKIGTSFSTGGVTLKLDIRKPPSEQALL